MVDDGSTDDSARICREFERDDERFIYVYQQNAGVGAARNKGVDLAKGEYITFVDSDDFLLPNHLDSNMSTKSHLYVKGVMLYDIKDFQIPSVDNHCEEFKERAFSRKRDFIDYYFQDLPEMNNPYYSVINKKFLLEKLKTFNIRFREDVNVGEDFIFLCDFFKHIESARFENERSYVICCHLNENSLTQAKRGVRENLYYVVQIFKALHSLSNDTKSKVLCKFQYRYLCTHLYTKVAKPFVKRILHRK